MYAFVLLLAHFLVKVFHQQSLHSIQSEHFEKIHSQQEILDAQLDEIDVRKEERDRLQDEFNEFKFTVDRYYELYKDEILIFNISEKLNEWQKKFDGVPQDRFKILKLSPKKVLEELRNYGKVGRNVKIGRHDSSFVQYLVVSLRGRWL